MSKVWQCDWCDEITPNKVLGKWISIDYDHAGPLGPPEFCSWTCVSEFAAQKARNER